MKVLACVLVALILIFPSYYNAKAVLTGFEIDTVLVLDPPPVKIIYGQEVVFTGSLKTVDGEPIGDEFITLWYRQGSEENIFGETPTDANGKFTWVCSVCFPDIKGSIEVYADYFGDITNKIYNGAVSQSYTIELQAEEDGTDGEKLTDIEIITDKASYRIGERVFVSGFYQNVVEAKDLYIIIFNPDDWPYNEGYITTDPNGRFRFEFTIVGEGAYPGKWGVTVADFSEPGGLGELQFEVTEGAVSAKEQIIYVEFEGKTFPVAAALSNGIVKEINVDQNHISLVIKAEREANALFDGVMSIKLSRDLIDSRLQGLGEDYYFIVLVGGQEAYYEETENTKAYRTLSIRIPILSYQIQMIGLSEFTEIATIEIVGTRVGSAVIEQEETVLTIDPPLDRVVIGDVTQFTGSLLSINGEPISDALIWILNDDGVGDPDTLASGFTDENGRFEVRWTALPTDEDSDITAFAYFAGGQDLEGMWINEAVSNAYSITLEDPSVFTEPEIRDAYMGLIGVWDKDLVTIVVVKDEGTPKEYEDDVVFAFKEWSRLLKEASGNSKAWNFDIVKDSKLNIFKSRPDVFVEIRLDDEGLPFRCVETGGAADPRMHLDSQKRFIETVNGLVFAACDGEFLGHDEVRMIAMHELAHTFGLGHAWNKDGDMMCSAEDLYGGLVYTCNLDIPREDKPSRLNLAAVTFLYGKDGFAEPNISPVPEIYAPQAERGFFYIKLKTDKLSYSEGETMKITAEVFDSSGKPVDIEPSMIGIEAEPIKLGTGKYLFTIQNVSSGKNEFSIKAGQSSTALSVIAKERVGLEELDVNVVMKQKKKLTLISVKNSDIVDIFGVKIKVSDGNIKFVKARGWDRDRIDESTIIVSTGDRPIVAGKNLIILLITDNPSALIEWSVTNKSGSELGKGIAISK